MYYIYDIKVLWMEEKSSANSTIYLFVRTLVQIRTVLLVCVYMAQYFECILNSKYITGNIREWVDSKQGKDSAEISQWHREMVQIGRDTRGIIVIKGYSKNTTTRASLEKFSWSRCGPIILCFVYCRDSRRKECVTKNGRPE